MRWSDLMVLISLGIRIFTVSESIQKSIKNFNPFNTNSSVVWLLNGFQCTSIDILTPDKIEIDI